MIHGPPGTGKTATLTEIIKKLVTEGNKRILVCGPSNLSVDNLTERLLKELKDKNQNQQSSFPFMIRLGHPSRVLETCQGLTLDFWTENSDGGKLLKDVQGEIDEIVKNHLPRCKSHQERRELYGELKVLRQERKKREMNLAGDLIKRARIVFCTLGSACGNKRKKQLSAIKFDVVVVDEAGQALLPECLIAPLLAKKMILAGDHCQLPPTVMNPELLNILDVSLFQKLILINRNIMNDNDNNNNNNNNDNMTYNNNNNNNNSNNNNNNNNIVKVMLREQYRMNEKIMEWSNSKFYGNKLKANEKVKNWKLEEINSTEDEEIGNVLIFYDTCGFDLWESETEGNDQGNTGIHDKLFVEHSKFNEGEAQVALDHYKNLITAGLDGNRVALISPYSAQVSLLQDHFSTTENEFNPEINSIDGFQGREKDVIILSLVRSNTEGSVGFLNELRRINVALTRAKRQLVVIGDSGTLSRSDDLRGLVRLLFLVM